MCILQVQVAGQFGVSISTAIRGSHGLADTTVSSTNVLELDAHEAFVVEMFDDRKEATLDEVVERLCVERQASISRSALDA